MSLRGSFMPKKAAAGGGVKAGGRQQLVARNGPAASPAAPTTAPAPPLRTRRATLEDAPALQTMYNDASLLQRENVIRSFGQQQIKTLIESCVLCLVVEPAEGGAVCGFAAFGDEAPHYIMRSVSDAAASARKAGATDRSDGGDWAGFVRVNFDVESVESAATPLTTFNTIWLRYLLLADETRIVGTTDRLLRALFTSLTQVDRVLVATPSSVDPFAPLNSSSLFAEIQVRSDVANTAPPALVADLHASRIFACVRAGLVPDLVLRRARIEDNDDLVPICNAQSEILTALYGEFFLATLIQSQDEHQHALVAEVSGRAVGLAGVTDQVDVKLLQSCFDLEPFEQLRKQPTPEQEAELLSGPTPITRMNNIFLTLAATTTPPLSAAELEAQRESRLLGLHAKRATLSKRNTLSQSLSGVSGMLKQEATAAIGGSSTPTHAGVAAVIAGGASGTASPRAAASPRASGGSPQLLLSPGGTERKPSSFSFVVTPNEAPAAAAAVETLPTLVVDASTTCPSSYLLNFVETFKPDPTLLAAAMARREAREEAERGSPRDDGDADKKEEEDDDAATAAEEQEEALFLNPSVVHTALVEALGDEASLTNQTFNDLVVGLMSGSLENVSMGGLIRFLELAVRVSPNLPVRPVPVLLDATQDDGTASDNVFCITLFCLDAQYESRSIDVLKAAFALYPERAFCVLTLPHTSPPSSVKLLQYFTPIRPTPTNTFSHALYLLHRDTIGTLGSLGVRAPKLANLPELLAPKGAIAAAEASNADALLAEVEPLIAHLPNAEELREEVVSSVKAALSLERAKRDGTEHMRLKASSTVGLSGAALLEKRAALRLQLLESKTSATETLLVTCLDTVVGVVLFNRLSSEEVELLRRDFGLDQFISLEDLPPIEVPKAHLPQIDPCDPSAVLPPPLEDVTTSAHLNVLAFVVNPLWNAQVGFICQEMLRIKRAHVLYYQVWSKRGEAGPKALANLSPLSGLSASYRLANGLIVPQLIDTFVQVRPRRRPTAAAANTTSAGPNASTASAKNLLVVGADSASGPARDALALSSASNIDLAVASLHAPLPCALHVLTRRLLSRPKTVINARLVVVGASTTSLAFLEALMLHDDKHYASVTLLAKDGLPTGASGAGDAIGEGENEGGARFLPWSLAYSSSWLDRLSLASRVKVVVGTLVDLDATRKTLALADGSTLPYDVLVLAPGLQNQLPLALIRSITAQALADEVARKEEARKKREEAARDARRKKKAQEQGLEDTSTLDAEGLARLDEELEREAAAARANRDRGDDSFDGSAYSSDEDGNGNDDDLESVASFDSKGKSVRRKRGRKGAGANGSGPQRATHDSWRRWVTWSSSGLERWEDEYGSVLAKQRALAEGTLDPGRALAMNAAAREAAAAEEAAEAAFDPASLDLTPWGISGLFSLSSEEHVCALRRAFEADPAKARAGGWLVNGASLDALTSVQGLIELGVPAANITWTHALTSTPAQTAAQVAAGTFVGPSSTAFLSRAGSTTVKPDSDDPLILSRVLATLHELGVRVLSGKAIRSVRQHEGQVHAVVLADAGVVAREQAKVKVSTSKPGAPTTTATKPTEVLSPAAIAAQAAEEGVVELPVVGVIGCGELDVDPYIFRAVHGSSLVYDGRLVLNHAFQTTIPSIYAAGPLAKFSRAYGQRVLQLEAYNSVEVGRRLCEAVLRTALDVQGEAAKAAATGTDISQKKAKSNSLASQLPSLGVQPQVTQALLPGRLLYFHAATPTHRVPSRPKVLVTQQESRLVRLVFNDFNVLASVTVVEHVPRDPAAASGPDARLVVAAATNENLVHLVGLPASYMNRILFRHAQMQISDLVHFLSEPWTTALYHESFNELRAYMHFFMLENRLDAVAIIDRVIQTFTTPHSQADTIASPTADPYEVTAINETDATDATPVDPMLVSQLGALLPPHVREVVQRAMLRFLRQHANHLPAYALPPPFYPGPQAKARGRA